MLRAPVWSAETRRILLRGLASQLRGCRRCSLCTVRKHVVFGAGNPTAPILVVGSRPGYWDDQANEPLAGETARQIFGTALTHVGLLMERDIYGTYLVKCLTPKEGDKYRSEPTDEAYETCSPFFRRQLDIIEPAIVVCHGRTASRLFLGDDRSLRQYLGHFRQISDKTIAVSTHNPAGLFGDRAELIPEYMAHWEEIAYRLHGLGRVWRRDAECFNQGWVYADPRLAELC